MNLLMHSIFIFLMLSGIVFAEGNNSTDYLINLVHQDCGSCHGITLKGGLGPDIRPEALDHFDLESLTSIVLDGIPETAMPPWRPLISESDARVIAAYLLYGETK